MRIIIVSCAALLALSAVSVDAAPLSPAKAGPPGLVPQDSTLLTRLRSLMNALTLSWPGSKPVHVKSLPAHAVRSLIIARKKLVGQRVTLENQIRGLAVVFGIRLPRALSPAFTTRIKDGWSGHPTHAAG